MRVLIVEPKKMPYETDIRYGLKSMQQVVGGYIEVIDIEENITLVCNEEGKLKGYEGNRRVGSDIIAGRFFICGCNYEGEFISLTDEQVCKYTEMFKQPEEYTQDEVKESIYIEIYSPETDYELEFEEEIP